MKKQIILCSVFICLALILNLTGNVLATNEKIETNTENIQETNEVQQTNKEEHDAANEARNLLSQSQLANTEENVEVIKEKVVIVVIAIAIALILIIVMWKYESY